MDVSLQQGTVRCSSVVPGRCSWWLVDVDIFCVKTGNNHIELQINIGIDCTICYKP